MSTAATVSAAAREARDLLLAVLVVVSAVFAPGLGGGFIFDDFSNLVDNQQLRALDWATLGHSGYSTMFSSASSDLSRPLAMATFIADRLLFDWQPLGWKVHSLLWHLLNTLLVAALARQWLGVAAPGHGHRHAAVLVALAWATLPLQVSTVLYVVQRMEMIAATAVLAALLAYGHGRLRQIAGQQSAWPWLLSAGGIATVGMLAKESAALFGAYVLVVEILLFKFRTAQPRDARLLRGLAVAGAVTAAVMVVVLAPIYLRPETFAYREFTAFERVISQPRALWQYIEWILLPQSSTMVFYYDNWPVSRGWMRPVTTAIAAAALAASVSLALAVRKRWPLVATGVLFFLAGHLLTSSYLPLELMFEHRNYLPALGLLVAAASLLNRDWGSRKGVVMGVVGLWLLASAGQTLLRASQWGASPLRLAEYHAEHAPDSSRACYDRALMYIVASEFNPQSRAFPAASSELARCADLPGASLLPAQAGILLHAKGGTGEESLWWDRLEAGLRDPMTPASSLALITLAQCRLQNRCPLDDNRLRLTAAKALGLASTTSDVDRAMGDLYWWVFDEPLIAERAFRTAMQRDDDQSYAAAIALTALLAQQCKINDARRVLDGIGLTTLPSIDQKALVELRALIDACPAKDEASLPMNPSAIKPVNADAKEEIPR